MMIAKAYVASACSPRQRIQNNRVHFEYQFYCCGIIIVIHNTEVI